MGKNTDVPNALVWLGSMPESSWPDVRPRKDLLLGLEKSPLSFAYKVLLFQNEICFDKVLSLLLCLIVAHF